MDIIIKKNGVWFMSQTPTQKKIKKFCQKPQKIKTTIYLYNI